MTTTLQRPAAPPTPPTPSGRAGARNGRRAVVRWSLRLYRREWRQHLVAALLLVGAVAATTVGLGLVGNVISGDAAVFGTANTRMDVDLSAPNANLPAELAQARRLFGAVEVIEHATVAVPGSIAPVDLRAQQQHGPFSSPTLRLTSGRYPSGTGQVAVTSGVAATFGLKIGSTWTADGRPLRVVGEVENPTNLQDDFGLVAPGQLADPVAASFLFDSSGHPGLDGFRPAGVRGIMSAGTTGVAERRTQSLLVLVLSTIGMVFVGLLSVAGFTVMAQRRTRALGMIGAIGATDRQVRLVMLANGAAVGIVGGIVGTFVGLAVWFACRPAFEHLAGHRIDATNVQWWAVALDAVLAVVTALVAAWWPARSVARMPIVAALSGRPAKPQPAHRFATAGCALLAVGFGLLVWAHRHNTPILVILGIVSSVAGMLLIAPLGIRVSALAARRSPIAVRLALRDLARYQARSGAALAAVSLAIGIAATIAVNAAAQSAVQTTQIGNLPANQLAVWTAGGPEGGPVGGPGGGVKVAPAGGPGGTVLTPARLAAAQQAVTSIAADIHADAKAEIDQVSKPNVLLPDGTTGSFPVNVVQSVPRGFRQVAQLYLGSAEVLALYHLPATALTADITTSRTDLTRAQLDLGPDPNSLVKPSIGVSSRLPSYESAPNTLISPRYVATLGLTSAPVGWLLQSGHPLTSAEIASARTAAANAGLVIEARNKPDHSLQKLRDYSIGIGVLVALGVLLMTVGLIRSETANDLRTLSATGASSTTRRTLTAVTAGALALLGGLLGTAGCYLALLAWNIHDLDYLSQPPTADLLALTIGLPLAAVLVAWLAAFRAPTNISHRPLE